MFLDGITLKEVEKKLNTKFFVVKDIYSTREKLDSVLKGFYTDKEKNDLSKYMEDLMTWLYSEDEKLYDKPTLEKNSKNMNDLGGAIYKRCNDWNNLANNYNNNTTNSNINSNIGSNVAGLLRMCTSDSHSQSQSNNTDNAQQILGNFNLGAGSISSGNNPNSNIGNNLN